MIIYTDGSAHPNPGPGGFGVVVLDDSENIIELYGKQFDKTTNNEQELKAILYALIKYGKYNPIVYSDSAYAVNSLTKWMYNWQTNGWVKADGNSPENLDIIKLYYQFLNENHKIDLRKIKGHNGNKWNELADKIATGKENI